MLNSLKSTRMNIGREISRAWENLSDGWRELLTRSSDALTHFGRHKEDKSDMALEQAQGHGKSGGASLAAFPRWSLLAGEVEETPTEVVVRVELPGLDKEDCHITIEDQMLRLSGEKRFERETVNSTYHVMERAYGAFQRAIPLPRNVSVEQATASFRNGVLTVYLPKKGEATGARIIKPS